MFKKDEKCVSNEIAKSTNEKLADLKAELDAMKIKKKMGKKAKKVGKTKEKPKTQGNLVQSGLVR